MVRYECDACGACCQGHLIVEAEYLDVVREPALLGEDRFRDGWSLEQAIDDLVQEGRIVLIAGPNRCSFLDEDCRCSIYPTRPNVCVAMEAGDEQCQDARQTAGLPPLEPVSKPTDPCVCELPGYYHSGVPGVLARLENGRVASGARIERCDVCRRYASDEAARARLAELGLFESP